MPVVSITLEDTNRSILSNAYYKIIDDIISSIKIPYGSLVVLHKDTDITKTDNKSNVSNIEQDNLPSTVSKRRVVVNITEEYNEDELTTTAVHQQYSYPIFQDQDINVFIYPIYIKSDINIEFSYISSSKMEATRIRDDIRIRLSQTRNINIHDIEYDILIPEVVEEFIADVYDLKSRLVPQPLEDYFREHSTKRLHLITDLANKENTKLAINEKQVRIVGLFDFNPMPDKLEIDNENNNYKITFNYKLSIDVPRAIVLRYPPMICNRPLPSKYLSFIEDNKKLAFREYKADLNYTSYSLAALSHFEAHRQLENRIDINIPMNIPLFDEFNVRQKHKGYGILVSFLTDIDETDKRTLFNLKEIDPYYISPALLDFILANELPYVVNPYMSFMYIGLWQDDKYYDNNILELLPDFTLKSKVDLSLYKPTRVTISIILDLTILDKRAINSLLGNLDVLNIFLNEYIRAYNNFKTENSFDIIPDNTFYKTLIFILSHYVRLDNTEAIAILTNAISKDKYIFNNMYSILYNNYPILTRYLVNNSFIEIDKINKAINVNHTSIENYAMRTVMTDYIVALISENNSL